jgi:hypothetical protein
MLTNTFYLWKILLSGKFSGKKAISNRSSHWFNAIINSPQVSRRLINWGNVCQLQGIDVFTRHLTVSCSGVTNRIQRSKCDENMDNVLNHTVPRMLIKGFMTPSRHLSHSSHTSLGPVLFAYLLLI